MTTAVCVTLRTPEITATALDGVVAEAWNLTPSFSGTALFPKVDVTTVAGG